MEARHYDITTTVLVVILVLRESGRVQTGGNTIFSRKISRQDMLSTIIRIRVEPAPRVCSDEEGEREGGKYVRCTAHRARQTKHTWGICRFERECAKALDAGRPGQLLHRFGALLLLLVRTHSYGCHDGSREGGFASPKSTLVCSRFSGKPMA